MAATVPRLRINVRAFVHRKRGVRGRSSAWARCAAGSGHGRLARGAFAAHGAARERPVESPKRKPNLKKLWPQISGW